MQAIKIIGGKAISGEIIISGAKNAALPLMATSLLTDRQIILENVPQLADIDTMIKLLSHLGVNVEDQGEPSTISLNSSSVNNTKAPYELVRKMRASVLVLGPLLARFGKAHVSLPGGCAIGTRPIDLHLEALKCLGAEISISGGYVDAKIANTSKRLIGGRVVFPKVTVGGTENIVMAASLAEGITVIENAAKEPEISDLAKCLNSMGAKIKGFGTSTLVVEGVDSLDGTTHRVLPDRIETGTYATAAAITRGRLKLKNTEPSLLNSVIEALKQSGVRVDEGKDFVILDARGHLTAVDIVTEPYPGFPTDMQAQWMAYMATVKGSAKLTETIFENRSMHVPELSRFGASVDVFDSSAIVRGRTSLTGAPVMATDLRASVSLVLLGLAAKGETIVNRVYHLDRGYERLEEKLSSCGANIKRIEIN